MRANKIFLRYYPPGLALNYRAADNTDRLRHFDLLDLDVKTNVDALADSILLHELQTHDSISTSSASSSNLNSNVLDKPVIGGEVGLSATVTASSSQDTFSALKQAINKLQRKLLEPVKKKFYLHKRHVSHILPLTNVCFDRGGERCLTGSYDRTCHVINTNTAEVEHVLTGHDNVVFSVGFNTPRWSVSYGFWNNAILFSTFYSDKVVTGSFDATAKVWSAASGQCLCTLYGHNAELVAAEFHPLHTYGLATASLDGTARVYDVETAQELQQLSHHSAEVIAAHYNRDGQLLLTGSFDRTAAIWDTRSNSCSHQLRSHSAQLSNCVWNFSGSLIATGSLDNTACIWDVRRLDQPLHLISTHSDEVLDVSFDAAGKLLATCSSDCTARVWQVSGAMEELSVMAGHCDEVSKVCFSPSGCMLLTASADNTARLWLTESGMCSQVLAGHEAEVFSCAYSYAGDTIITASKDNTCKFWR
ncbi:LOW QUALITY PROTEIN: dynein assembly factor with WDR repeat domains 1 [Scaptodrosophila lebanonensis]|uniref:LOW QUALITY PROTEIN: dynein assembly factor with WDR repeat domains 1 n=1 Tax=Drosophila lebanonensis TaxID=7225 RepID=A0A6J2T5M7_DROLE|nr:LOW QUALITY PROTEIN: dynein assembly factor with WDR repeat domains 1 [Scaptodrosophila lebanonensis]